ncbi:hypothetical protein C6P42_001368 [Pichia californica]|nr:hypothetical protein C6P42_001368 [[Candida] californica]
MSCTIQLRKIYKRDFSLFSEITDINFTKKESNLQKKSNIKDEYNKNSILDMLSGEFDNNDGKGIERAVHKQVNELERLNEFHGQNVKRLANKLTYIQENIGIINEDINRTNVIANELIDMPIEKVINMVKNITNNRSHKLSSKAEMDLIILLSHLVFRNALTADLFSRIIMKIGLFNLRKIHSKFIDDPADFIKGWNKNPRFRIVCGLSLTARYKYFQDFKSAQMLIRNEFQHVWMNTLINNPKILHNSDVKNMINTIDGLVEYGYLVTCMIRTKSFNTIYSFWENHPNDGLIKEWLENEICNDIKINPYQKFIIEMYTNAGISTVTKWRAKVLDISKKLRLSILNIKQVNKSKFCAFTEMLLNEMEEEMDNDIERREYFYDIKGKYDKLKMELIKNNDMNTYNFVMSVDMKTFNV